MYPLGHIALGYFSARATNRITGGNFILLGVWFLSVFPDIDVLIPFLIHRGPTHSLAAILVFFVPVVLFRREWLPYVTSFGSHALIGDLITGAKRTPGIMLFWPVSSRFVNVGGYIQMGSGIEMSLEIFLFAVMVLVFFWDSRTRLKPEKNTSDI
jgi:membrane-bound metal-dependent hydrolase YbcI (DUF457 family)